MGLVSKQTQISNSINLYFNWDRLCYAYNESVNGVWNKNDQSYFIIILNNTIRHRKELEIFFFMSRDC